MLNTIFSRAGLKKDKTWSKFVLQWLTLSFILHLIAVVRSSGFYHADEHFQIIEFMNYKLGRVPVTELPLEFGQMMRPWLLPSIFAGITSFLNAIGVQSPFDWALSYRLLSGILGWLSTAGLTLCCYLWFPDKKWRKWAVITLSLLWYIPTLHARPSSENLSGSVFFIGLCLLILASPPKSKEPDYPGKLSLPVSILGGLLFGFAFEFRYQVAFMIAGAFLWLLILARISILELLTLFGAMLIPIGLGTIADHWGYGQWTCAAWNYFQYNIVQNKLSASDISPWWDYFRRASTESWPLLGLLTLISFPIAWIRNPKHVLTWTMVPFFLAHEIIGHKELRFLFPLAHAGGVLLLLSVSPFRWPGWWREKWRPNWNAKGFKWSVRALIVLNFIALGTISTIPAWMPIRFYSRLYNFKAYGFQVYYKDDSIYNFGGAKMNFYRHDDLQLVQVAQYSEFIQAMEQRERPIWFFNPFLALPDDAEVLKPYCKVEFSTLPDWIENMGLRRYFDRVTNWTLFKCQSPNHLKKSLQDIEQVTGDSI